LDAANAKTLAGPDGKWRLNLDLQAEAQGPFSLVVEGKNKLTIADVLVGQVWVCGGQSNMELAVSKALGADAEQALPENRMLRQFLPRKEGSLTPVDDGVGQWTVAGPTTVGDYTAVGYYFAKKLQHDLQAPVGFINAAVSGTPVEAWMSADALAKDPDLKSGSDAEIAAVQAFPQLQQDFETKFAAWTQQYQRQDHVPADVKAFAAPGASLDGWKTITLPGSLAQNGLPAAGAIWIRRQVDIPATPPKALLMGSQLSLGNIHGFETVYWNGVKIGEKNGKTPGTSQYRRYGVPVQLLEPGTTATLAVRIYNPVGDAALNEDKSAPFLSDHVKLAGPWMAKAEYELPPLAPEAMAGYPLAPHQPELMKYVATNLNNGVIHPLIPYAIKGAVWYQGESNATRAVQYRTAFPLMIQDWRAKWNQGDFPFYFCQLVNFMAKAKVPTESAWAELRDAQASALSLPNTGMAVLIDLGEAGNLHPRNKRDAGERLALIALAKDYGQNVAYSGPTYASSTVGGDHLTIHFTHADGGLVAKPLPATYLLSTLGAAQTLPLVPNSPKSQLEGFQVCGDDHKWQWADAKIAPDGTVAVSSPAVPKPAYVRYAWSDDPTCNLYNGAGLPAAPFRTDDFPLSTAAVKFGPGAIH